MERQLKERLIGAAVLIAIAVVLVPEMFTGPAARSSAPVPVARNAGTSEAATDQVKTWRVDLQAAPVANASSSSVTVQPPAPQPRDELAAAAPAQAENAVVESSAASVAVVSSASSASSRMQVSSQASVASSAPPRAAVSSTSASSAKSVASKPEAAARPTTPTGKWQVQVGSFGTEANAHRIAAQLKSQGQTATVSSVQSGGKTLYRVRVAAGASRDSAQAILKKLSATYPGASVVAPDK